MRIQSLITICLGAFIFLFLSACTPKPAAPPMPSDLTVAVAGFHLPQDGWQLLSSSRADPKNELNQEYLDELDAMLLDLLRQDNPRTILGTDATRQCQELALSRVNVERGGVSGLQYWLQVGECTEADYLLVPQVLEWREREGGEWGVTEPGMVVLELTLLDIRNKGVAKRFQYDERQSSLSENLLQINTFFRRGAKWLPTKELIRDGLREGLREMGL